MIPTSPKSRRLTFPAPSLPAVSWAQTSPDLSLLLSAPPPYPARLHVPLHPPVEAEEVAAELMSASPLPVPEPSRPRQPAPVPGKGGGAGELPTPPQHPPAPLVREWGWASRRSLTGVPAWGSPHEPPGVKGGVNTRSLRGTRVRPWGGGNSLGWGTEVAFGEPCPPPPEDANSAGASFQKNPPLEIVPP